MSQVVSQSLETKIGESPFQNEIVINKNGLQEMEPKKRKFDAPVDLLDVFDLQDFRDFLFEVILDPLLKGHR